MSRRAIMLGLLGVFVLVGAGLFAAGSTEAAAAPEKIVRIALSVEPGSLDLHADTTTASMDVAQTVYETLLRFDYDMKLIPWLATSWEQLDEVTYRFKLREGVTFHSGNPFNAEAVKANMDRMTDPVTPGLPNAYLNFIKETRVLDEYTVEIQAKSPYGPALAYLALPFAMIHDTRRARELGESFGVQPSGTGPFVFERWDRGSAITLKANKQYWGGAPAVDGLQFRIIPEAGSRTIALRTGEVHITTQVPPQAIPQLQNEPNLNVIIEPEPRIIRWQVNLSHPILSDINVRRALTHAIDYDMIIEAILGDFGTPVHGYTTPEQFGYLALPYAYNPQQAADLLRRSGWAKNPQGIYQKDGKPLELEIITGNKMARELELFEAMQSDFRDFGIVINLKLIEGAQIYPEIVRYTKMRGTEQKPDFALLTMDLGTRTGEGNVSFETSFRSNGTRNCTTYSNPEFDRLMDIAVSGAPADVRLDAYHKAQRLLHEALPAIHLWQPSWAIATTAAVTGFRLHPAGVWYYNGLQLRP